MPVLIGLVAFIAVGFTWFDRALGDYLDEIRYERYVGAGWIVALLQRPAEPEARRLRTRALKRLAVFLCAMFIGFPAVVVLARGLYLLAGGQ